MHKHVLLLFAAAALGLTGCGSSGPGTAPTLVVPVTTNPASTISLPTFPASSPVTSPVSSLVTSPVTPPVSSPSAPSTSGCPNSATICDTFGNKTSGWPVANVEHYFAQYDQFGGGTYRLGERTAATISEDSPVDIATIAADYSVQVDVDATRHVAMPGADDEGISCWEHRTSGGATSAFLFFVNTSRVEIGLWDYSDGSFHRLAQKDFTALHTDGHTADHLTALCLATGEGAALGIAINGNIILQTTYARSTSNFEWVPAKSVGVLASGKDSDVFYDNFAITSLCQGDLC